MPSSFGWVQSLHPSSNISVSLAWFPLSSNACLLEPRATQQDLLPGNHLSQQSGDGGRQMEPPPSTQSRLLGWPSAEAQSCRQLPGCVFNPLQTFGPWEPRHTGKRKRSTGVLKHEKNLLQNFQCILTWFCVHLLLHSFSSFCACQSYRELLLEVFLEAELPKKVQTNPLPKQHSIQSKVM